MSKKKKDIRQQNERKMRNKSFLSSVKTAIKKAKVATSIQDKNMKKMVSAACSMIDKAVTKNIFKKNKAGRLKSKLQIKLQKAEATIKMNDEVSAKITDPTKIVKSTVDNVTPPKTK